MKTTLPKNYLMISWQGKNPRNPYGLPREVYLQYHWWLVFELNGKPCRLGPAGTTFNRMAPSLPTEEEFRSTVNDYLQLRTGGGGQPQSFAYRVGKFCPLSLGEVISLPIVVKHSTHKYPGWKPLDSDHPLNGVKVLTLSL